MNTEMSEVLWGGFVGKGTCPRAILPVFDPQEPHGRRRELTLVSYSLTSTYKCDALTCASPLQINKSMLKKKKKQYM